MICGPFHSHLQKNSENTPCLRHLDLRLRSNHPLLSILRLEESEMRPPETLQRQRHNLLVAGQWIAGNAINFECSMTAREPRCHIDKNHIVFDHTRASLVCDSIWTGLFASVLAQALVTQVSICWFTAPAWAKGCCHWLWWAGREHWPLTPFWRVVAAKAAGWSWSGAQMRHLSHRSHLQRRLSACKQLLHEYWKNWPGTVENIQTF